MWVYIDYKHVIFPFSKRFKPILKPKHSPHQWVPVSLSVRVRRSECEADQACPFNVKVKAKKKIHWSRVPEILDTVSGPVSFFPCTLSFLYDIKGYTLWGTKGGRFGIFNPPPKFQRPSKIVPNSTRLRKMLKIAEFRTTTPQDVWKK